MSDLELYVLQWNIAHFRRLLSTETDEGIRSRIAALLALHPALDANYRAVAGDAYAFGGKAT